MTRNMTQQNKNRSTERFNEVELRGLEPTLKIAHTARFRTFKNLAHIFLYSLFIFTQSKLNYEHNYYDVDLNNLFKDF